jgi:catechol 2,3-dioxygenase-like lactoylglutathione lyase family enzyme
MTDGPALDIRFSHVVIAVTDVDSSVAFYRDALGMDVVFDQVLSGQPFRGRAVGGLLGGVSIELLQLESPPGKPAAGARSVGLQLISLSVPNLDGAYLALSDAVGAAATKPFDVDGVRMFFVTDPDGTVIEFVEFPGAARTPAELHRGVGEGRA